MAGKQDKISHICQESCSLFSYSIAKVLLYVFVQDILSIFYKNLFITGHAARNSIDE